MTTTPQTMTSGYAVGLTSLSQEVDIATVPVVGEVPAWLSGSLIRNGPALWDTPTRSLRHWFDGMAMLHRFGFENGEVSYSNRLLDTAASRAVRQEGKVSYGEFASDPCAGLFGRFFTRFHRRPTPNACVNVAFLGQQAVALTETPLPVEFDPRTLETLGVVDYDDDIAGTTTTAHPHVDPTTGDLLNFTLAYGRCSEYRIYRQRVAGDAPLTRELVATVASDRPGYLHSFAVTQRYVVLMIFPLVVNPLSFVLRGKPFIENYRWRPELDTRIVVVDSTDGSVRADTVTPACFGFHHINAYDDLDDDGTEKVVIDLSAYPDASIVQALYLDRLRAGEPTPMPRPTRFTVALDSGRVQVRPLSSAPLELPRIAYGKCNGRPYRYAYGTGAADSSGVNFLDQLVKLDTASGTTRTWRELGCYPGEPVFVAQPDDGREDAGVVLSVVLDAGAGASFLLVLDASTFQELARATVPHAIPFGFHGQFARADH